MKRAMLLGLSAMLIMMLAGCSLPTPPSSQPTAGPVVTPAALNQIIADATVIPERTVDVSFAVGGTVAEILVQEGALVQAGAPLARLDTSDLELQLAQSQASLVQAQASYAKISAGVPQAEIDAQQALVRQAQAQLERSRSANVTSADIASAQAQLRAAQARLDALKNPPPATISAAQLSLSQAQNALTATRTNASAAKTNAELAMQQATAGLTVAQASYATATENWNYVHETGADPTNPTITDPATGKRTKNKLNDVQERQYYAAFVQAEASVHSAEKALTAAQVSYDQARQDEITQIQQAEAAFANAQQQFDSLKNPGASDLAQSQANVDQARANLQKLQQGGTKADIAAAQAAVDQAQANAERLISPPRTVDLAEAQARIAAAQVGVQQAKRTLEQATLRAPFAGIIAERHLEVGQQVASGATGMQTASFVLISSGRWKIETTNLNERNIVRLQPGSPVQISFDALLDLRLTGKVTAIQPRGIDRYGDITYTVMVTPDSWDERLRWNMSATVVIDSVDR